MKKNQLPQSWQLVVGSWPPMILADGGLLSIRRAGCRIQLVIYGRTETKSAKSCLVQFCRGVPRSLFSRRPDPHLQPCPRSQDQPPTHTTILLTLLNGWHPHPSAPARDGPKKVIDDVPYILNDRNSHNVFSWLFPCLVGWNKMRESWSDNNVFVRLGTHLSINVYKTL